MEQSTSGTLADFAQQRAYQPQYLGQYGLSHITDSRGRQPAAHVCTFFLFIFLEKKIEEGSPCNKLRQNLETYPPVLSFGVKI